MMWRVSRWTQQQVIDLAPDPKAVVAARKLAKPGPWSETGSTEALVWGKCQGSGSTPYQVSVDLTGPAFKCTCPSRKFPCKHGLALLLLWVEGSGSVAELNEPSAFAQEWQAARGAKATATRERRAAADAEPADPAARAKRLEQRLDRMDAGADELERWTRDLVREGLGAAKQQPYTWWDQTAGRLVDAQLPAMAERVRAMAGEVHRRDDWSDHLLAEAGRWYAATRAWRRRDELAEDELADLRVFLGWAVAADDLRDRPVADGTWQVLGVHRTDDGRLQEQRSWLRGTEDGTVVQVLDFATVGGVLRVPQVTGAVLRAQVRTHPGSAPARGSFVDDPVVVGQATGLAHGDGAAGATLTEALDGAAARAAANPWSDRSAAVVRGRIVAGDPGALEDAAGDRLPLAAGVDPWPLLALTGGHGTDLFVELEAGTVRPLTLAVDGVLVPV